MDLQQYRESGQERLRIGDLLRIMPKGRATILEIGAREGYHSRVLTEHFREVTALDLKKPGFEIDRVRTVQGDVRRLTFSDDAFDCVLCPEVLEHIADIEQAAAEIKRVARYEILIGVPFKQDTRVGRLQCAECGKVNPPWGHVQTFDQERLERLFAPCRPATVSFVGTNEYRTNALSAWLLDRGGNPWGTYDQDEPCIYCGAKMKPPTHRGLMQRVSSWAGHLLNRAQALFVRPRPNWIHLVFEKRPFPSNGPL